MTTMTRTNSSATLERRGQAWWERQLAHGVCLRRPKHESAGDLGERFLDGQTSCQEIDRAPSQRRGLSVPGPQLPEENDE
jgi:hypothetical protein